jgi:hypothetical protein
MVAGHLSPHLPASHFAPLFPCEKLPGLGSRREHEEQQPRQYTNSRMAPRCPPPAPARNGKPPEPPAGGRLLQKISPMTLGCCRLTKTSPRSWGSSIRRRRRKRTEVNSELDKPRASKDQMPQRNQSLSDRFGQALHAAVVDWARGVVQSDQVRSRFRRGQIWSSSIYDKLSRIYLQ